MDIDSIIAVDTDTDSNTDTDTDTDTDSGSDTDINADTSIPTAPPIERGRRDIHVTHGRSRTNKNPRIPTLPGRSTSGFHQRGARAGGGQGRLLQLVHEQQNT